jgi:arginyl-tRNA synthetase
VFISAQDRLKQETNWQPKVNYRQYLDKVQQFDYEKVKELYFAGRKWSLEAFEVQYRRLGTKFDYYFYESEVGETGFEIVKQFLVRGVFAESQGAVIFPGEKYDLHNRVFINALGLPTYEAKELGLAPTKYQLFAYDRSVIVTANEIDEYFKVLLKAMELTLPKLAKKTRHVSHGMVKLTSGKMSSRTGKIIKGKDLLDSLKQLALQALDQRQGLSQAQKEVLADKVAVSAVKFAFLRSSLGGDIVFDPKQAVAFTGESGPYIQYSYVRTQSVWRKLASQTSLNKDLLIDTLLSSKDELSQYITDDIETEEIEILRMLNQYFDIVNRVAQELKPHLLANYLFKLAQSFSRFYEQVPILTQFGVGSSESGAKDLSKATKRRLLLVEMVGQTLKHGLWVLGIETVEEM